MRTTILPALLAACLVCTTALANAGNDTALADTLARRLHGDRSGACVAAAVIDKDVKTAFVCAKPGKKLRIGPDSAFEIGSITKTMTAALLAELINQGKASLDDPLADYLPEGTEVPAFEGQPILLRHVVTHSSGLPALPPDFAPGNPADPYASLTDEGLLASLAKVSLHVVPGTEPFYSNYALMLLSYAITRRAGKGLEALLREYLFGPLGMKGAYIAKRPADVRVAVGHLPGGQRTSAWNFPPDLAGVGGVRATLDDMVRYVQAQIDPADDALGKAIRLTHEAVDVPDGLAQAMTWFVAPVNGQQTYIHEGGTGGFSSLVAFDLEKKRGVVLLSDTAMNSLGGLGNIGMHLLDPSVPLGAPRVVKTPDAELLDGLEGNWVLENGLPIRLLQRRGRLYIHPQGQPEFEMGYDSYGDFYPLLFDAALKPSKQSDGTWTFAWHQGGGVEAAKRVHNSAPVVELDATQLKAYEGTYGLMPNFDLKVTSGKSGLQARATGQGAFPLVALGDDRFEAAAYGIVIQFERDAAGAVRALQLMQGGQTLQGERR